MIFFYSFLRCLIFSSMNSIENSRKSSVYDLKSRRVQKYNTIVFNVIFLHTFRPILQWWVAFKIHLVINKNYV